ncbi:MAG: hypothetical protein AAB662_01855 [Patescibacteria group bacterium]
MIIPYSPLPDFKSRSVLAPLIPVTFYNGKYEFSTFALVDSGATGGVISTVIANALHIKWEKIPVMYGFTVGGTLRSHRFNSLKANIYDHEFSLSMGIVEGTSPYKCILGQRDLFQRAKIIFEAYKNQFELVFREYN